MGGGMSAREIHHTALVDPRAELGEGVRIGAYSTVGPNVRLADGVVLHNHVVVTGNTRIGRNTQVYPFAVLGARAQDKGYQGEDARLEIGANNLIREQVTMNAGTDHGGLVTRVGDGGMFMVGSHVAHDCQVGNAVIFANAATLGGHCVVEDNVIISGLSAIHQFVRIGAFAFIGGMTGVENDVIPYGMAIGNRAGLSGLNIVGLKRLGVAREQIHRLRKAYRLLFAGEGNLLSRIADVEARFADDDRVQQIIQFIRAPSKRALCVPRKHSGGGA